MVTKKQTRMLKSLKCKQDHFTFLTQANGVTTFG